MKYPYPEIQGSLISIEGIQIGRVREMADAISRHPYMTLVQLLRQVDGTEIIIAICDVQIKQHTAVPILETEEIAIICDKDNLNFPEVYALRGDFPLGLPHTNLKIHERPVSLCVTEFLYKEVKHLFNPYIFLESIRIWFSLTSSGKLHQDDQHLEPYFHTNGVIIIPPFGTLPKDQKYSVKHISSISGFPLYSLQVTSNINDPFICKVWLTDAQVSGFIHKKPTLLSDIKNLLSNQGTNLIEELAEYLDGLKRDLSGNKTTLENKYAFLLIIPIKRNSNNDNVERQDVLFFTINEPLKNIGILLGLWTEQDKNLLPLVTAPTPIPPNIDVLDNVPISMYSTMIDFIPEYAANLNDTEFCQDIFSIIGVGALGSQLLNNLCRMGFGKWIIIDNDCLLPHNLARHLLSKYHLGQNKSVAVSLTLNHMLSSSVTVPLDLDFVNTPSDVLLEKLKDSKAIIDTSTSISVARRLALDFEPDLVAPRISIFLTPSGNDLVLLAEDTTRTFRLDFLEMQYYRTIYQEEALHEHLKREVDSKIRYVSHSCRDITQKISQDMVAVHSAIASKALKQTLVEGNARISIWHIVNDSFEIKKYEFTPTPWKKFQCRSWTVFIDTWAISKMLEHRKSNLPNETGGVLIGSIDYQRKILYLIDSLLAPPDSIKTGSSFIRGVDGLKAEYDSYLKLTDNQVIYLGEWHSHPNKYSTRPSSDDKKLFSYLSKVLRQEGNPTLMLIVGDTSMNFIFELI